MNQSSSQVMAFDFRRPDQLGGNDLDKFRATQAAFAENLAGELSRFFRAEYSAGLENVRQSTWGEYCDGITPPTCALVLGLRPQPGYGVLELTPSFVFPALETLLGGKPEGAQQTQRELTSIERKLLDGLFQGILRTLRDAWTTDGIGFALESVVTQPASSSAIPRSESLVVADLVVNAEPYAGTIRLAVPARLARPPRQENDLEVTSQPISYDPADAARILARIAIGKVRAEAFLCGTTISIGDLAALEPGDILNLQRPAEFPLRLRVNGVDKFAGFVVPAGDHRAFAIQSAAPSPNRSSP